MRQFPTIAFLGVVILAAATAMPAKATLVSGSFSGILQGTDTYGYYGTAGASLTGQSVTGTYSFDTSLMTDASFPGNNLFGVNGTNPDAVSLSATILGLTISASAGGNGAVSQFANDATHVNNNLRAEPGTSDVQLYLVSTGAFVQGQPITSPFTLETNPSYTGYVIIAPSGGGSFDDVFTFTQLADVPEPASLTLLGLGAVALGAVRRRRT